MEKVSKAHPDIPSRVRGPQLAPTKKQLTLRLNREVVDYFNAGIPENNRVPSEQIATQFHPLNLSQEEIDNLVEFLKHGLYDKGYDRFVPDEILSGNCFPNNDPASREALGCE